MWNAVEVLVQVVMTFQDVSVYVHNTSIIGWVKINALHIDTQVERIIVKRGGQAKS